MAQALDEVVEEISRAHPDVRIISHMNVRIPVQCDLGRIRQLLTLLLRNAIDHGARRGSIGALSREGEGTLFTAKIPI